jgi:hypothetical protein
VFDRIFGGTLAPQMDTVRAVRKSVLDYVAKDIGRFSRTLGTEDRLRIDGHLSSIRGIENRLTPSAGATGCQAPVLAAKYDVKSSDNYEKVLRAQIDIGVAALAAGSSQVLTILSWLGFQTVPGMTGDGIPFNTHHGTAHSGPTRKNVVDKWFFDQVAYLIGKLKAEKEGSSSIFDNSVVLVTNNMNYGGRHEVKDLSWLLAGSAGGYFKTGRLVRANNASHTQVLVGICNALGVSADGFADPAYGGELPGLRA